MHYKQSVFRSLAMVTQLGLSVVTPIFLCIFAGYQLDTRFGIKSMVPPLPLGGWQAAEVPGCRRNEHSWWSSRKMKQAA